MTETPTTILPYLSDGRLEHQSYPPAAIETATEKQKQKETRKQILEATRSGFALWLQILRDFDLSIFSAQTSFS